MDTKSEEPTSKSKLVPTAPGQKKTKEASGKAGSSSQLTQSTKLSRPVLPMKDRIPDKIQKGPEQAMKDHDVIDKVKLMIADAIEPYQKGFPELKAQIVTNTNAVRDYQTIIRGQQKHMDSFKEGLSEIASFARTQKVFENDFRYTIQKFESRLSDQDVQNQKFVNLFKSSKEEQKQLKEEIKQNMDYMIMKSKQMIIDRKEYDKIFDKAMKDQFKEYKKIDKRLDGYETLMENIQYATEKYRAETKDELRETIDNVVKSQTLNNVRLVEIESKLKNVDRYGNEIKKLTGQTQMALNKANEQHVLERYIHQTLPVQIHLQICEALDKVLTESTPLQPKLIAYEQFKNKEMFDYIRQDGNRIDSLKCMNDRLGAYLKYMAEMEQGCLPFSYGIDVHNDIPPEHYQLITAQQKAIYKLRYQQFAQDQQNILDTFDIIKMKGPRNAIIIGHKMKKLQRYNLVLQLQELINEEKLLKMEKFDELDIYERDDPQIEELKQAIESIEERQQPQTHQSVRDSQPNFGNDATKKDDTQRASTIHNQQLMGRMGKGKDPADRKWPEQMYFLRTEHLRPYLKFEHKFSLMFEEAFEAFNRFKKKQLNIQSEQSKVIYDIQNNITEIRQALQDQQEQVDQNDSRIFEDLLTAKQEFQDKIDKVVKKIDQTNAKISESNINFGKFEKAYEDQIKKDEEQQMKKDEKLNVQFQEKQEVIDELQQQLEDINDDMESQSESLQTLIKFQQTVFGTVQEMIKSTIEPLCNEMSKADLNIYDQLIEELTKGDQLIQDELRSENSQIKVEMVQQIDVINKTIENVYKTIEQANKMHMESNQKLALQTQQKIQGQAYKSQMQIQMINQVTKETLTNTFNEQISQIMKMQGENQDAQAQFQAMIEKQKEEAAKLAEEQQEATRILAEQQEKAAKAAQEEQAKLVEEQKAQLEAMKNAQDEALKDAKEQIKKIEEAPKVVEVQKIVEVPVVADPPPPKPQPAPVVVIAPEIPKVEIPVQAQNAAIKMTDFTPRSSRFEKTDKNKTPNKPLDADTKQAKPDASQDKPRGGVRRNEPSKEQLEKKKLAQQKEMERKRQKAEQIAAREKERKEKAEKARLEKEQREQEEERRRQEELKKQQLIEQRKKEDEERKRRREEFRKGGVAVGQGLNLMKILETQTKKEVNKMLDIQKKKQPEIQVEEVTRSPRVLKNQINLDEKDKAHTSMSQRKRSKKKTNRFQDSEEEDEEDDDKPQQPQIDVEQLQKTLDEKLEVLKKEMEDLTVRKISTMTIKLTERLDHLDTGHQDDTNQMEVITQNLSEQIANLRVDYGEYKNKSNERIHNLDEALTVEGSQFQQMKKKVRSQIQMELDKVSDFHKSADYEFRRMNSFLYHIKQMIGRILEDQMLMQMIQEQDVRDRQQIGLFGVRKNQELLGVNQGATRNIFDRKQTLDGTEVKKWTTHEPTTWDMQNKDQSYDEVVGKQFNKRKMSVADQSPSKGPLQDKKLAAIEKPFNNIQVSQHCASCHGFAPQILSQIKLACLSYMSSPIEYSKGTTLSVADILQIKEKILKRMEGDHAIMSQLFADNQSMYGMLTDPKSTQFIDLDEPMDSVNAPTEMSQRSHFGATGTRNRSPSNLDSYDQSNTINTMGGLETKRQDKSQDTPLEQKTELKTEGFKSIESNTPYQKWTKNLKEQIDKDNLIIEKKINPYVPVYLNQNLKYNIPSVTHIMLKKKYSKNVDKSRNEASLKIEEKDLYEILDPNVTEQLFFQELTKLHSVNQIKRDVESKLQRSIVETNNVKKQLDPLNDQQDLLQYITARISKNSSLHTNFREIMQKQEEQGRYMRNGFNPRYGLGTAGSTTQNNPRVAMRESKPNSVSRISEYPSLDVKAVKFLPSHERQAQTVYLKKRGGKRGDKSAPGKELQIPMNIETKPVPEEPQKFPAVEFNFKMSSITPQNRGLMSYDQSQYTTAREGESLFKDNSTNQHTKRGMQDSLQSSFGGNNNMQIDVSKTNQFVEPNSTNSYMRYDSTSRSKTPQNAALVARSVIQQKQGGAIAINQSIQQQKLLSSINQVQLKGQPHFKQMTHIPLGGRPGFSSIDATDSINQSYWLKSTTNRTAEQDAVMSKFDAKPTSPQNPQTQVGTSRVSEANKRSSVVSDTINNSANNSPDHRMMHKFK